MAEAPVKEFSSEIKTLADKLVSLSVKDAQALVDCLKQVHGIEPAGGGAVMMAPAAGEGAKEAAEEKTQFDVILVGAGDKKIQVIQGRAGGDGPRPEGSQGPGGRRSEAGQGRDFQGRGRQAQG